MLSRFTIKRAKHYAPNWFNCLTVCLFEQSQASIILKSMGTNAVVKRKDSNCVGIVSYQGEVATVSNLSEYTIPVSLLNLAI